MRSPLPCLVYDEKKAHERGRAQESILQRYDAVEASVHSLHGSLDFGERFGVLFHVTLERFGLEFQVELGGGFDLNQDVVIFVRSRDRANQLIELIV
jgi:hypothetical protein